MTRFPHLKEAFALPRRLHDAAIKNGRKRMKRMLVGMAHRRRWLSSPGNICKASSSGRVSGPSDMIMRSATPRAGEVLGEQIVMIDRTGGAGAICEHVREYAAGDGHTLLMGAATR